MSAKNAIFDGWDLAAHGMKISMVDMHSRAKNVQLEGRAVEDGLVQVMSRYSGKPVVIEGRFDPRATVDDLETAIDEFMLAMSGDERILDIEHGGSTRRFIATAQNTGIIRERGAATIAGFSVEFVAPDGYGSDTASQTLLSATQTTATTDHAITVGGSYKAQPDIMVTINSLTGGDPQKSISLTNTNTTEGITVTRNWAAGDVLLLNAADRSVYVNNTQIFARGAFPSWPAGTQYITYSDDFSARNVSILATYTRRWL